MVVPVIVRPPVRHVTSCIAEKRQDATRKPFILPVDNFTLAYKERRAGKIIIASKCLTRGSEAPGLRGGDEPRYCEDGGEDRCVVELHDWESGMEYEFDGFQW